jgi:hypothetical protein
MSNKYVNLEYFSRNLAKNAATGDERKQWYSMLYECNAKLAKR